MIPPHRQLKCVPDNATPAGPVFLRAPMALPASRVLPWEISRGAWTEETASRLRIRAGRKLRQLVWAALIRPAPVQFRELFFIGFHFSDSAGIIGGHDELIGGHDEQIGISDSRYLRQMS